MHSENSKNAALRRANDEFLRQLLGGEPTRAEGTDRRCPAARLSERNERNARPCRRQEEPSRPPCNQGDTVNACPKTLHAPALAMVYSPMQCFEGVLAPEQALRAGTQFAALVLPLEEKKFGESEVNHRRCTL